MILLTALVQDQIMSVHANTEQGSGHTSDHHVGRPGNKSQGSTLFLVDQRKGKGNMVSLFNKLQ